MIFCILITTTLCTLFFTTFWWIGFHNKLIHHAILVDESSRALSRLIKKRQTFSNLLEGITRGDKEYEAIEQEIQKMHTYYKRAACVYNKLVSTFPGSVVAYSNNFILRPLDAPLNQI